MDGNTVFMIVILSLFGLIGLGMCLSYLTSRAKRTQTLEMAKLGLVWSGVSDDEEGDFPGKWVPFKVNT